MTELATLISVVAVTLLAGSILDDFINEVDESNAQVIQDNATTDAAKSALIDARRDGILTFDEAATITRLSRQAFSQ